MPAAAGVAGGVVAAPDVGARAGGLAGVAASPGRGISSVQSRLVNWSLTVIDDVSVLKPNMPISISQTPGVRSSE